MSGPYGIAAYDYQDAGWSPIPLPPRKKHPVPKDYTGADGQWVDRSKITRWVNTSAGMFTKNSNIALRLPKNVIGIDVDMYDGKAGRETLSAAENRWGPLPDTWVSSSRDDGSGIRLFRVPGGLAWDDRVRGADGSSQSGIELVRWDHRYCIVAPSIHDTRPVQYQWRKPDGSLAEGEIPAPEDLPELPAPWVEGLTGGGQEFKVRAKAKMADPEIMQWLEARPGASDAMCETMRRTSEKYVQALNRAREDGGAHDEARNAAWAVIRDSKAGHAGVLKGLRNVRDAFFVAVEGRRDPGAAKSEWRRAVVDGVKKTQADDREERDVDDCAMAAGVVASLGDDGGRGYGLGPSDLSKDQLLSYPNTDTGNGRRFILATGGDLKFAPLVGRGGTWMIYDGARWVPSNSKARIWAQDVAQQAAEVARAWLSEDPADISAKSAAKWFHSSSMTDGLSKMLREASQRVETSVNDYDQNPRLLACPNGTLELTDGGVVFRGNRRSDMVTLSTGVEYHPDATSELFDKFLAKVVPDEELRLWLQMAMGYSLIGDSPDRILFIVRGPTASGKTTLMKAINAALGGYSGMFNLSMFRNSQEERARADIVDALPKRMLFASEASSEWHLHADQVKGVTGGDLLKARKPFASEYLEMVPAFTPWLFTNEIPTIDGADKALWDRLIAVPFNVSVPQAERINLSALFAQERPAVLAWLVRGWDMFVGHGTIRDIPATVVEETYSTRIVLSELDTWISECCNTGSDELATPAELFMNYKMWSSEFGSKNKELSGVKFGKALKGRGYAKKQKKVDGTPTWHYFGIGLKNSSIRS